MQKADCCESIALPGGPFEMGRSVNGKNQCPSDACNVNEEPAHRVTLSPYALDRFEVTVSRFRKFVDAWNYEGLPGGAAGDAVVAGSGWQLAWNTSLPASKGAFEKDLEGGTDTFDFTPIMTWTSTPGYYENLPINGVTWYQAFAFCAWDGGRLPTEAEWEFAAANGAAADLYPWGEAVPTATMSVYDCALDPDPCEPPPPFPAYVGSRPEDANRWGHRDLAGNVAEWTLDAVGPYPAKPVTNYANTAYGYRVIRGGDFGTPADALRATFRGTAGPGESASSLGFRCARTP
jgi:formylglycine-generating enzyme required for sulfatase activity